MKFTEKQLKEYAAPLSTSEDQQCKNAIAMVRDALVPLGFTSDNQTISPLFTDTYAYSIRMTNKATKREVKIFIQGSYANNTNVKTDSDVDIAIVQEDIYYTKFRPGVNQSAYNISDAPKPPIAFKDEILSYLRAKFGTDVERGNISIKIHGNTYRKDADTVPCSRFRDYSNDYLTNISNYVGGIKIFADDGSVIINYPEQHIENGKAKNVETNYCYKKMVRIAKKIRNLMISFGYLSASSIKSFGLESLLWNVPNSVFTRYTLHRFTFDEVIQYLYSNKDNFGSYLEANGIKTLCPSAIDLLTYRKFIDDLKSFYAYDINEV